MSLGPVMLDIESTELSPEERELLQHPLVGGVILFTRNYAEIEQLEALVSDIHNLRDPHLLVAVDHEGGRVQRFRDGFTPIPAAAKFGQIYKNHAAAARALAKQSGWMMAIELRAIGIDFSFAPVLDVEHGVSTVIGDRAFHSEPDIVAELAFAYMSGMQEAGMAATAKHFPGHGAVAADSHTAIPVDHRSFDQIASHDLVPFRKLVQSGIAAVMPAHVIYTEVDPLPAGYSEKWLKTILRNQLNFQGVIFSDDLDMAGASAISEDYAERAAKALAAGCDMVLVCNNRSAAIHVLDTVGEYDNPVSHTRLVRMHGRHPLTRQELHHDVRWREASTKLSRYQDDPSYELELNT